MQPLLRRHAWLAAPAANTCSRNNPQNKRQQRPPQNQKEHCVVPKLRLGMRPAKLRFAFPLPEQTQPPPQGGLGAWFVAIGHIWPGMVLSVVSLINTALIFVKGEILFRFFDGKNRKK